jgi:hypothetical protein
MEATVGLQEAAKMAAVSSTTVRRWAQTGAVAAAKSDDGVWQIDRQSLMVHLAVEPPRGLHGATAHPGGGRRGASASADAEPEIGGGTEYLRQALTEARQRISDLERSVREMQADKDSLHREKDELHRQIGALHAEFRAYFEADRRRLEAGSSGKSAAEVLEEIMSQPPATPWWKFWGD